jgi:hypothetical protein
MADFVVVSRLIGRVLVDLKSGFLINSMCIINLCDE